MVGEEGLNMVYKVSYLFLISVVLRFGNNSSLIIFQFRPCVATALISRESSELDHSLWSRVGSKECCHRFAHSARLSAIAIGGESPS
jgi:hypothetical protein